MTPAAALWTLTKTRSKPLLAASVLGWLALLVADRSLILPVLCTESLASADAAVSNIAATFMVNSPLAVVAGLSAMLLAMMPLVLTQPIAHVRLRSLARRRWRGIGLLVVGYAAVWLIAGIALTTIAILLISMERRTGISAFGLTLLIVFGWQLAPLKQLSLNRCHRLSRLSAFGFAADRDCLVYGLTQGAWCVGACWALMLVPLVTGAWHLVAMAGITLILIAERFRPAQPARWGMAMPRLIGDAIERLLRCRLSLSLQRRTRSAT